jgi:Rps23 Pro-64 3,4-dihydroxylase Tpa1-like proline 4-hydroxylase
MNSSFETAKEHFLEYGYCNASLKDIDLDFYNYLESNFLCDEENNIQNKFFRFRFDSTNFETVYRSTTESYEDARIKKEEFLSLYNNDDITQCWFGSYVSNNEQRKIIQNGIYNICKYFYNLKNGVSLDTSELELTYYDKGCRFRVHHDAITINLCSIIIYLNKNYNRENGGLLYLNGEEIIPEFGNIGFMDLSKSDISHGVSEVTGGPGRYAILAFPKLLQQNLI